METDEQYWVAVAQDQRDTAKALFFYKTVINKGATDREGHVVTSEQEWVKIIVPGDDKSEVVRRVSDEDRSRWPEGYARFAAKRDQDKIEGTRIREWPYLTRDWVAKLEFLKVHTVEEVANASDTLLEKLGPGARDLKARAADFLRPADKNEQAWRQEKKDLQRQIDQLKGLLNQPDAPKKRGRPKKDAA
jgi:hypothetical protein